jgi:hypothetical protein
MMPEVQPVAFTRPSKGGKPPYEVEGILDQGGKQFPKNGFRTCVKARFLQRL